MADVLEDEPPNVFLENAAIQKRSRDFDKIIVRTTDSFDEVSLIGLT